MKNKIILVIVFLQVVVFNTKAQYNTSMWCHRNVYDPATAGTDYKDCIDATFKYQWINRNQHGEEGTPSCTGVLINRNTDDGNVHFYFLSARHCFYAGLQTNMDMDPNQEIDFYFNYQSRNEHTGDVPVSNRGNFDRLSQDFGQTRLYNNVTGDENRYQYHHRSRIEVISAFAWGDMMLCEILTPIPPHFNVTYAGWNPNPFRMGAAYMGDYAGVHHPAGDIKKISKTPVIVWGQTPIATKCYTVTKVIDVLFGWIWKRRWSTSVICNYVDNPYLAVPNWTRGTTQQGSSGSGIYTGWTHRLIGTCTGFPWSGFIDDRDAGCVIKQDLYGKLSANYGNAKVKNTFNPEGGPNNRAWIDIFGMPSRKITCYPNLNLPGDPGVSGEYFPAKDYQSDNTITLQAVNNINTTGEALNIYPEADYRFRAGNTIILNNGFDAKNLSFFVAEIGGCQSQSGKNGKSTDPNAEILTALRQIKIPKQKVFDPVMYMEGSLLQSNNLMANIYPNPNNGNFNVKLSEVGNYDINITDLLGKVIYTSKISNTNQLKIQLSGYPSGTYFIQIGNKIARFTGKVVIQ